MEGIENWDRRVTERTVWSCVPYKAKPSEVTRNP